MASALDEEWFDFLDRYIPFEVNSRRPRLLKKELQKLVPIIPDLTRTGPRDMESFKLYLREVIFNHIVLWEETLTLTESDHDSSTICIMLRIMDYLSQPSHTNEDYYTQLVKQKREIARLQEEVKELRAENWKLSSHSTKQPLFKSSYTKIMTALHLSQERSQVGLMSSAKIEENESKTQQLPFNFSSKLSIKEVQPTLEDKVVKKADVCQSGFNNPNDPCPCAERVVKILSGIIKTELMCVICRDVISKPVLLQCGHMFCETCLQGCKELKMACPYCRSRIQCEVEVPIDSFMVEMFKLILSNCSMKRSRSIKHSDPTKKLVSSMSKTSDSRTIRRPVLRRPERFGAPSVEENRRN